MTAISFWENKIDAEAYNTNAYPEVLKSMARFTEGTPKVQTSDVVNSTFLTVHNHHFSAKKESARPRKTLLCLWL